MSRALHSRLVVVGGLLLAGLTSGTVIAGTASAAELPAPTVSSEVVTAGQQFTLSGTGCTTRPGGTQAWAEIQFPTGLSGPGGKSGAGVLTGADAAWSMTVAVNADAAQGRYSLSVVCDDYNGERVYPTVSVWVGKKEEASTQLVPGRPFRQVFSGFKAFERVHVVLHSTPIDLGWFTADAAGRVTIAFTTPTSIETGAHALSLAGDQGTAVQVAVAATKTWSGTLAATGSDIGIPLAVGIGFLLAGTGLLVAARRRTPQERRN